MSTPTTTARDIMTPNPQTITASTTLADAARLMRDLDVGSLPICVEDDKLTGMITDRDIVSEADIAQDGNTEEVADTVQAVTQP